MLWLEVSAVILISLFIFWLCAWYNFNFGWSYKHFGMLPGRGRDRLARIIVKWRLQIR